MDQCLLKMSLCGELNITPSKAKIDGNQPILGMFRGRIWQSLLNLYNRNYYNLTESSFAKGHRFHQPNTRLGQSKNELWFLIRGNWQMPWCILCIRYTNISIYCTHIGLLVSSDVSYRLWFQRCFLIFMFYPWRFGEMMRFDLRIFVQSGWTQTTNHIQYIYTSIFYIDMKCHYISKLTALPGFLSCFCAEKAVELEALHLKFSTSEQSEKMYLWINSWERRKVVKLKCLSLGSIFTVFHDLCLVGSFWGRCCDWMEETTTYKHTIFLQPWSLEFSWICFSSCIL